MEQDAGLLSELNMAYACLGSPYRPDGAAVGGGTGWWAGRRGPSGRACCGGEDGSGREGHAAQPVQREQEPAGPWPARGQVQVEAARGAGEPAGQGQERVRRVLVVIKVSPRPIRLVQRARLWAMTARVSQAALAANFPQGKWLSPTPYLRSRMVFSTSAWQRWSASSPRVVPWRSAVSATSAPSSSQ